MEDPAWVAVGRLVRPRGLKGEFVTEIYSSQPGRAESLKDVRLVLGTNRQQVEVERVWYHGGNPILKFSGIDTLSQAEPWQGADLLVPEADRARPGEGEYSHGDLIGCSVWSVGQLIGVVRGIQDYGGGPLLEIEAADGREILVPFAKSICKEIDVSGKVIRADLPEGLTEL